MKQVSLSLNLHVSEVVCMPVESMKTRTLLLISHWMKKKWKTVYAQISGHTDTYTAVS